MMFFAGLLMLGRVALAAAFPQPVGYVNDFAEIISPAVEARLEAELESFTASTSNELAVVTLKSLEGDTVDNTAVALFEQWGIGQKGKDNGVLLLIAPNERELRIEVGYGLEPILTDSRTGTIRRDVITPKFKQDDYEGG
ncbi:MAG: TPM domain-containing protein, partial [Patescibacteria group bacterium]|nr:TPM domain-containing protein [Patescibacteria group bacterium]